jgi:hypothetical protein
MVGKVIVEKVERGNNCYVLFVRYDQGERKALKVIANVPPKEGQTLLVCKEMGVINVLQPL